MGRKTLAGTEEAQEQEHKKEKRIDLSVAQVAGSSLATVAAAVLASKMGVYGTILGAGVVSVVATAGGPVIQHFFRRTGEQLREAGDAARPASRQVPVPPADGPAGYGEQPGAVDATRALPAYDRHDRTMLLRAPGAPGSGAAGGTWADGTGADGERGADGDFGSASTHGTRVRGWKRTAVASAVVFGVAMGGITAYETLSGSNLSGGHGSTLRTAVTRDTGAGSGDGGKEQAPAPTPRHSADGSGDGRPDPGKSPGPAASTPGSTPTPTPSPTPTPTPTPTPDPTPTPIPTPTPSTDTSAPPTGGDGADGAGTGAAAGAGAGRDAQPPG